VPCLGSAVEEQEHGALLSIAVFLNFELDDETCRLLWHIMENQLVPLARGLLLRLLTLQPCLQTDSLAEAWSRLFAAIDTIRLTLKKIAVNPAIPGAALLSLQDNSELFDLLEGVLKLGFGDPSLKSSKAIIIWLKTKRMALKVLNHLVDSFKAAEACKGFVERLAALIEH